MVEKSLRVLHISALTTVSSGIFRQLCLEQDAANKLGINWVTTIFSPAPNKEALLRGLQITPSPIKWPSRFIFESKLLTAIYMRRCLFKWLKINEQFYDIILIRYVTHDPWLFKFLNSATTPVGLIHHAIEDVELDAQPGFIGRIRVLLERIIGPRVVSKAQILVGVTPEILGYQLSRRKNPTHRFTIYPNGGDPTTLAVRDCRGALPELIFIASHFFPWQGLDKLLEAMQKDLSDFKLHIVGTISGEEKIMAELDSRVEIHGTLSQEEIEQLVSKAWLGLSSFALERQGMKQACALKNREYLAMGLPVYGSHNEVLPDSFPFYKQGSVSISEILKSANDWRDVSREEVRNLALPLISKVTILENFYADIKKFT